MNKPRRLLDPDAQQAFHDAQYTKGYAAFLDGTPPDERGYTRSFIDGYNDAQRDGAKATVISGRESSGYSFMTRCCAFVGS